MRRGTKDMSALRRSAVATSRATRVSAGSSARVRIKLGWNIGAADPAFAMGQNELRWIESGLGDDRRIARGGTFSSAVDGGESLRLVALYPVERGIDERKARRGIEIVRAAVTLAVVNGASEGRALRVSPNSSIG